MTRITNVQPLCRVCGKPLGNPACTACGPVKEAQSLTPLSAAETIGSLRARLVQAEKTIAACHWRATTKAVGFFPDEHGMTTIATACELFMPELKVRYTTPTTGEKMEPDPAVEAAREIITLIEGGSDPTTLLECSAIIRRHFPAKAAASSDTKEPRKRGEDLLDYGNPFQSHGESLVTAADTIDAQAAEIEHWKRSQKVTQEKGEMLLAELAEARARIAELERRVKSLDETEVSEQTLWDQLSRAERTIITQAHELRELKEARR